MYIIIFLVVYVSVCMLVDKLASRKKRYAYIKRIDWRDLRD